VIPTKPPDTQDDLDRGTPLPVPPPSSSRSKR
jgi:hypothetical protein